MFDIFKKPKIQVQVSGVTFRDSDGTRNTEREYFHVIKTVGKKRFSLTKNGEWFEIDKGGGLIMDCAFVAKDGSADVWDR